MVKIEIICAKCQRLMRKINVNHTHNRVEIEVECPHCGIEKAPPDPLPSIPTLFGG